MALRGLRRRDPGDHRLPDARPDHHRTRPGGHPVRLALPGRGRHRRRRRLDPARRVLSAAQGEARPILLAAGGALVFGALVLLVGRRLLAWAMAREGWSDENRLLVVVAVLFGAAWFTDTIQLYAVFGAFCVGMVMPGGERSERLVERVSTVPRAVLLPMFFTYPAPDPLRPLRRALRDALRGRRRRGRRPRQVRRLLGGGPAVREPRRSRRGWAR
ncbi:cation:proton antiporter [Streptomyces sp. M19]